MREIKFRAWDEKEKSWVSGFAIHQSGMFSDWAGCKKINGQCVAEADWKYQHEIPHIKIMQYTGLKDKNGKEIYEGDIVQFYRHSDITHRHEKTDVSIIRFYLGSFVFDAKHVENRPLCNLWRPGESMEVIGNIYEHPHLLKGEENA